MSIIEHIQTIAEHDPVEAADMLVKSACTPDPNDPLRAPWSLSAGIESYKRIVGPLTPEQEARVRAMNEDIK